MIINLIQQNNNNDFSTDRVQYNKHLGNNF